MWSVTSALTLDLLDVNYQKAIELKKLEIDLK